jgi:hypothetical protein
MGLVDRLEKIGRLVLWLTLAATCVIIPLEYTKRQAAAQREVSAAQAKQDALAAQLEEMRAAAAKRASGPERITLASVGPFMHVLNEERARAEIWFTNVSPRAGVICLIAKAQNDASGSHTASLPVCRAVAPYESSINMTFMLAGNSVDSICKNGCTLSFVDAKDSPNTSDVN